ncbi:MULTISPECIES: mechanosensitive ion channel domain-containing protein [unclassified Solwaraspora]|uniref:mechanosensitive ion channel family protein n=1 Tax=unclassified Solwaraspora TaxID=2627926 RepID=UPI00248C3B33|nr:MULTISPECIES: mechanosensitive ion channel domain-containing protein [unclassified Solwaraspora]WBB99109.1 mechanosensitive ion channel [Solwaraspora sp. WMMA2059]WBC22338.1 mechanosensitive ion channel [Solwaraspora sp. WMMA2080]WJK35612.1 mechanosensitive ion channel [Solwaraspora sp. WMMA2065]
MHPVVWTVLVTVAAAVLAVTAVAIGHRVVRRLGRRSVLLAEVSTHAHRATRAAATVTAIQLAVRFSTGYAVGEPWRRTTLHLLVLAMIAACAWLVGALLLAMEDTTLARFRTDVPDNRHARRLHTQVVMLRRVTIAVIVILTVGVMLMTFPAVRGVGASLLASAGVIGVVGALAAQSLLSNVIAGLQLAFSDAVRIDDVVVVEGEWGRIEELTLSYVVVHIWDDRRLILPTSYFTTTPFQNWTRTKAAVLGTAEFDLDWSVPVQAMREELRRLVEGTELWDGRVCVLQVTDATGGTVRLRALVSAADSPSLWDLRCQVREHLASWVREQRPTALPRWRAEVGDGDSLLDWLDLRHRPVTGGQRNGRHPAGPVTSTTGGGHEVPDDARLFGGDAEGDARASVFVGPEESAAGDRSQQD